MEIFNPKNEPKKDELLTSEEAVVYQDYATTLSGREFSEQATMSAYMEAEDLINRLRDREFDWLNIDWDKLDFNDVKQIQIFQKRLNAAVQSVIQSQSESGDEQEKGVIKAISQFINSHPVSLAVLASILIAAGVKNVIQNAPIYNEAINTGSHIEINDEIQDVSATSPKNRENLPRWHGIYVRENIQENTEELHITLQDGKKLRCVAFKSYGKDGEPDTMRGVSCDWE